MAQLRIFKKIGYLYLFLLHYSIKFRGGKIKVNREFIKTVYSLTGPVDYYTRAVTKVGLWQSERIIIQKYCADKNKFIIDIGCGAGRAAFGIYKIGYHNITGIDLSGAMIKKARIMAKKLKWPILFYEADIAASPLNDNIFDLALFSFNGFMQIPGIENRILALKEIKRILKPKGFFIFTTHDRDMQAEWRSHWEDEEKKWKAGDHDPSLYDFGDKIIHGKAKNERTYLHFPDRREIIDTIKRSGLLHIEDVWRSELCTETDSVRTFAFDNRFWVAQKL